MVVGGGAMGAATAFHLAQLGVTDVVLLERDALASGSTSKSAGGFRTQFADELNVQIALRSIAELERLEELTGQEIALRRDGYLFLLDREEDVATFRTALALQQGLGVPSRELTVEETLTLVPQLSHEGLLAATYCPLDGYCSPEAVVHGYARAAAALGVRVRQSCPLTGMELRAGRITAVETPEGRIATGTVVCVAGAWSPEIGRLAGVELPVRGEPRSMWFSPQDGGLPQRLPLTIDFATGFYFHREGPGIVLGGREQTYEEVGAAGARRLPLLADLPIRSTWSGLYEVSPDHNAIVGEAREPARFLYATGFSGHGFQQAPAVGEHLAELIVGRTPTLDLSGFAVDRFATGATRAEAFVV